MRAPWQAVALLAGCCSSHVSAKSADDFWDLPLQQLSQVEVNVSSRSIESARDAAASLTVLTRRDIEATGATTVEQLMAFVPGFSVQNAFDSAARRQSFAVRGRQRGGFNRDVLVLRDGLALNSERLGGAGQTYFDLPLHNVRQIEIIRGPGSALYGSGAFLGVINIVTDDSLNNAAIAAGSHDLYRGHVNVAQAAGGGTLVAQAQASDTEGEMYRDLDDGMHLYTQDLRAQGAAHDALLKWKNETFHFGIEQQQRKSQGLLINRFVDDNNAESVESSTARAGFVIGEDSGVRHAFDIAYNEIEDDLRLVFMSREYLAGVNLQPVLPSGYAFPERDLVTGTDRRSRQWETQWQTDITATARQKITLGASFRRTQEVEDHIVGNYNVIAQVDNQLPFDTYAAVFAQANLYVDDKLTREVSGFYVQDRIQISDVLRADLGLRYDHYTEVGEAFSPRSSLVWRVQPDTDLKLLYSRAFRAPSLAELYNSSYNQDVGNPELDPETIDTLETVWAQHIGDAESILTFYRSDVDDGIDPLVLRRTTGSNYEYAINQEELTYAGVEWELLWQLSPAVSVRGALHHSFHADAFIDAAPNNSASVIVSVKHERWMGAINAVYYDEIETPAQQTLDDYTLFGITVGYDIDANWRVTLVANNVFDEQYRVLARRYNTRSGEFGNGAPGESASQLLTVSYRY